MNETMGGLSEKTHSRTQRHLFLLAFVSSSSPYLKVVPEIRYVKNSN